MSLMTIIVIAVGLAMDAFAVSVTNGATYKKQGSNHAFRMAFAFGGFQAIMPIVGWLAGLTILGLHIGHVRHYVLGPLQFEKDARCRMLLIAVAREEHLDEFREV